MNIENLALGYVKTAPSPATTGTSLTLETDEGARFPTTTTASFFVTLMPADAQPHSDNAEIVEVTDRTGDVLTIVRGQRGTTAQNVDVGWIVLNSVYKEDLENLNAETLDGQHAPTGDIVGTTDTQTLTNKTLTSPLYQGLIDGWVSANETWEYVSVDDPTGIFRVNADVTGKYSAGMRIKFTNGTYVIYGIVTVVGSYSGGYTSITFLHQIDPTDSLSLVLMANSAITANYYSNQKAPFGFPLSPTKWSVTKTDYTERTQTSPSANTWYNINSTNIVVPIGVWSGYYELVHAFGGGGGAGDYNVVSTLSTANNSESDSNNTVRQAGNSIQYLRNQGSKRIILELSSKTTYYINNKTQYSGLSSIKRQDCVIKFTCAYL